ncbi:hypothetical protein IAU59_003298 [Kwoniella sp. CBS 9459]
MLVGDALSMLVLVPLLPLVAGASIPIEKRAAPVKNNGKRGLAYNQAEYTLPFSLSGQNSKVSWAYNWGQQETSSQFNSAIEFVPMLWSNHPSLTSTWSKNAQTAINNGASALLSFNEPDLCIDGSACMSVADSVTAYQRYMQPFAGKALLGSPAVTNGGSPLGLTWLGNFIGNCTGCQIDFVNIHWYSNKWAGATYFKYQVQEARKIAGGRPIWITEFGLDNSDGTYTQADLHAFLQEVLPWLDQQSDVHRYAYFMNTVGMLINNDGKTLSDTGVIYNNYTDGAAVSVTSTTVTKSSTTIAAAATVKSTSTSMAAVTSAKTSMTSKASSSTTSKAASTSTSSSKATSVASSHTSSASASMSKAASSTSAKAVVSSTSKATASSSTLKVSSSSIAKASSASSSSTVKVTSSSTSKASSSSISKATGSTSKALSSSTSKATSSMSKASSSAAKTASSASKSSSSSSSKATISSAARPSAASTSRVTPASTSTSRSV